METDKIEKDNWSLEEDEIKERPDIGGLLRQEFKNKITISEYKDIQQVDSKLRIISGETYKKLKLFCSENNFQFESIVQLVWHTILSIYGNSSQTIIGNCWIDDKVSSNFVFYPLVLSHSLDQNIIDSVGETEKKLIHIKNKIKETKINLKNRKNNFDSAIVFNQRKESSKLDKEEIKKLETPLLLIISENVDKKLIEVELTFALEIFNSESLDDVLDLFEALVTNIILQKSLQFSKMELVNFLTKQIIVEKDKANIITSRNKAKRIKTEEEHFIALTNEEKLKTMSSIFEEIVELNQDKTAVIYKDIHLSYRMLNEKANMLAHHLRSLSDIHPDDIIGLMLDKSELMIISILAVWKSGAAYVPIDPNYPEERINFILEDTKSKILITNQQQLNRSLNVNIIKVDADSIFSTLVKENKISNLGQISKGNNLAYVICTSGTTGRPKGVLIEQRNVVSLLLSLKRVDDFCQHNHKDECILFITNYVFDVSVEQILLSIFNKKIMLVLNGVENIDYDYLNNFKIAYLSTTPTNIQQISLDALPDLKFIALCGEKLNYTCFNYIKKKFRGRLLNVYGPAETTVYATYYIYDNENNTFSESIGKPLSNTKVFVLNSYLQLVPVNAIGELYIAGDCVGRGYLNRPELTPERFIPNPYRTEKDKNEGTNTHIYKTGDLVRLLHNGELEYLGRNDLQVKIRGLRIELGEVESVLSLYRNIKQCVVVAKEYEIKEKSQKFLVGYYVSDSELDELDLKEFMQTKLPDYMIPNRLIRIDKVPKTTNGKLDTKALPELDFSSDINNYASPRNRIEEKLCEIWSEILSVKTIGIKDDFFRLGGDSISSIRIVSKVRQEMGLSIFVKDIFIYKTIERLYENKIKIQLVEGSFVNHFSEPVSYLSSSSEIPLLPVQNWFILNKSYCLNYFNQSFLIKTPFLCVTKLNDCLQKLFQNHDVFKYKFKRIDEEHFCQYIDSSVDFKNILQTIDLKSLRRSFKSEDELNLAIHHKLTNFQNNFNIENGPLFAVCLISGFDDESCRIWFGIHNLIIDSYSWRVICEDLESLYNGSDINCKTSSYSDWSNLISYYGSQHKLTEGPYWQNILKAVFNFNKELNSYNIKNKQITTINVKLDAVESSLLLKECPYVYNTQINVLLLTALGFSLKFLTKNTLNYVTLEGHGREEIADKNGKILDVSRTVGSFTTMFPVRLCTFENNLKMSVFKLNDEIEKIPNKGIGFGAIVGYKNNTLPRVSFNYLGQINSLPEKTKPNGWYLTEGIVGDTLDIQKDKEHNIDLISINGHFMNSIFEFSINSKFDHDTTKSFSEIFKSKLQEIVKNRDSKIEINQMEYHSPDFEDPFVTFNDKAEKILFILPPCEGGAESYFNNVVLHLSKEYKLVLFNNFYLYMIDQNLEDVVTYENLASFYINYVKKIQKTGPYNFLGWGLGGITSFEMSRQLSNLGDKIENIFIIDSYFNIKKAMDEINEPFNIELTRIIHYMYTPIIGPDELFFKNMDSINIVLFKASLVDDNYKRQVQLKLIKHYMDQQYYYLDTFIDKKFITVIEMKNSNQNTLLTSREEVEKMCADVNQLLTKTNFL